MTINTSFAIYSTYFSLMKIIATLVIIWALHQYKRNSWRLCLASILLFGYNIASSYRSVIFSPIREDIFFFITEPLSIAVTALSVFLITRLTWWTAAYIGVLSAALYQFTFTVATALKDPGIDELSPLFFATAPIYFTSYFILGYLVLHRVFQSQRVHVTKNQFLLSFFTFFPIDLFNHLTYTKYEYDTTNSLLIVSAGFAYLCCMLVLYGQQLVLQQMNLAKENAVVKEIITKKHQQYQVSKSNIEYLNKAVHDLMHNLSKLYALDDKEARTDFLDNLSSSLTLYDSFIETGNKALDTILTEKNIYCLSNHIHFKCFIKDLAIDHIDMSDLYMIFSGLLDALIAVFLEIKDVDKRFLSIHATKTGNLNVITIQAYFENSELSNDDYDIKSARYAVEKYDGDLTVDYNDSICSINILIPSKNEKG